MNDNNLGLPDKPDPNEQTLPQQPIVLRAPQGQQPYIQPQQQSPAGRWVPPQGMGNRPLSMDPTGRKRSWKNDPAYRVLFIAIGVVLLSSLAFVGVLAAVFNQPSSQTAQGGPNTQKTAAGRVNISSPTPAATPTPTPTLAPTATPIPTPTPILVTGPLTVEITNVANPVQGGKSFLVNVHTNYPKTNVQLVIVYNTLHFPSTTELQKTDGNGDATITWNVPTFRTTAIAQITALAQDQQGKTANSKTVKVTINTNG
jgi:hypothetical protein